MSYTVIRDTREQPNHGWNWDQTEECDGTITRTLATGDYSLEGLEHIFTIDRKGTVGEFYSNLWQRRFEAELQRMDTFEYACILLEFELSDILTWPFSSKIPKARQKLLKFDATDFLSRFMFIRLKYPYVDFVFAGAGGKPFVTALFKKFARQLYKAGTIRS